MSTNGVSLINYIDPFFFFDLWCLLLTQIDVAIWISQKRILGATKRVNWDVQKCKVSSKSAIWHWKHCIYKIENVNIICVHLPKACFYFRRNERTSLYCFLHHQRCLLLYTWDIKSLQNPLLNLRLKKEQNFNLDQLNFEKWPIDFQKVDQLISKSWPIFSAKCRCYFDSNCRTRHLFCVTYSAASFYSCWIIENHARVWRKKVYPLVITYL